MGFLTHFLLQNIKKNAEGPSRDIEKFSKKTKIENFESVTVPKKVKRATLRDFSNIHSVPNFEKMKGSLWCNQRIWKKSPIVPKKIKVKNNQDNQSGDPLSVSKVLDVGFVLDKFLTFPACFGHP